MNSRTAFIVAIVFMLAGPAHSQSVDETLSDMAMLGINRDTGNLMRYDFASASLQTIGAVQSSSHGTMMGIEASVYFENFGNVFALWTDPADNASKLVYVDVCTAEAAVVVDDVEGGRFTGAVGLHPDSDTWTMFAMQQAEVMPPAAIAGLININPNNSPQSEFECTRGDGSTFTRDDLHQHTPTDANGVYYEGDATYVHVKPKGNGNQNSLMLNGEPFALQNSNTYSFSGEMQVCVYNDHIHNNGKAMGHWWIEIISGNVVVNSNVQMLMPNRITQVDHKTGIVTELMVLARAYKGLASTDGIVFFAVSGQDLYRIDTVSQTETWVGQVTLQDASEVEFAGAYLMGYNAASPALVPINPATAANLATPASLGMGALGTIMFTPVETIPDALASMYD